MAALAAINSIPHASVGRQEKLPVPFTDFYLEKIYLAKTVPNLQMRLEARTSTKAGSTTVYRYTEKRYEPQVRAARASSAGSLSCLIDAAFLQGCPPWDSDRKHLWLNMRRITKNEFVALLPLAASDRQAVKQHVRNFVWKVCVRRALRMSVVDSRRFVRNCRSSTSRM